MAHYMVSFTVLKHWPDAEPHYSSDPKRIKAGQDLDVYDGHRQTLLTLIKMVI